MSRRGYTINIKDSKIITDEDRVHAQVVAWLRWQYPGIMYRSDPSGELMLDSMRLRQARINMPGISWPDLQIPEARRGYFGLFIEMKREDENLFNVAGMYKNEHLLRQSETIQLLVNRNYYACFEKGFEAIRNRIQWYLTGPPTKVPKHHPK